MIDLRRALSCFRLFVGGLVVLSCKGMDCFCLLTRDVTRKLFACPEQTT
jgi:hypothetical protein